MIDSLFLLVELASLILFLFAVSRGAKLPKNGNLGVFSYEEDPDRQQLTAESGKKGGQRA